MFGSVFSAFSGAGSAAAAGQAQQNAANYNAAVANNNAIAAQQAAAANAQQQARINSARQAKLESGLLASGVTMEGTPLLLVTEEAAQNELERQKILHQGQVQAANYQNQATLDQYNGSVAAAAGQNKSSSMITSGIFGGIGDVGKSLFRN